MAKPKDRRRNPGLVPLGARPQASMSNDATPSTPSAPDPRAPRIRKRVNVRFVLIAVGVVAALGLGLHVVHGFVAEATAGHLKDRASAAEERDPATAIRLYAQYLQFEPRDTEALLRLGKLLDEPETASPAALRRVYFLYESVLTDADLGKFELEADEARQIRSRLVDMLISMRRYEDALFPHLVRLQEGARDDGHAELDPTERARLLGREGLCHARLRDIPAAIGAYLRAATLAPEEIDHYTALAVLLENEEAGRLDRDDLPAGELVADELRAPFPDPDPAPGSLRPGPRAVSDGLLAVMVERGRPVHDALLMRAGVLRKRGDDSVAAAWRDLVAAREARPDDADPTRWLLTAIDVKLAEAMLHGLNGRADESHAALEEASRFVAEGLELADPPELAFYLQRYVVDRTTASLATDDTEQRLRTAVETLTTGIEQAKRRVAAAREEQRRVVAARLSRLVLDLRWALGDLLIDLANAEATAAEEAAHPSGTGGPTVGAPNAAATRARAEDEIAALEAASYDKPLVEFLRARIAFGNRAYAAALARLEPIRPLLVHRRDLQRRIDALLGLCYSELSNEEARRRTFARALVDDPSWTYGRLQLADSLTKLGRDEDAAVEYAKVGNVEGIPLALAELELRRLRRLPADRRKVARLRDYLKRAAPSFKDNPRFEILSAEALSLEGRLDEARRRLESALEKFPRDVDVRAARIQLAVVEGRLADADRLLATAVEALGPRTELVNARIVLALEAATPADRLAALKAVETECDRLEGDARRRALRLLAAALTDPELRADGLGARDTAARMWRRIAEEFPADLESRLQAYQTAKPSDRDHWLAEIARVEGVNGPNLAYLRAESWIASQGESWDAIPPTEIREVRAQLQRVTDQRPGWAPPFRLRAILEQRLGRSNVALDDFELALARGDRSQTTVQHLIQRYFHDQRFEDVVALHARVTAPGEGAFSEEFTAWIGQMAHIAEWQVQQTELARVAIRRRAAGAELVPTAPPDYDLAEKTIDAMRNLDRLRLLDDGERRGPFGRGLVAEAAGDFDGLFAHAPREDWLRLLYIAGLARAGEIEPAGRAIAGGMRLPNGPEFASERSRVLAECRLLIGDDEGAARDYAAAIAAAPREPELRWEFVDFHVRRNALAEALEQLDAILDPAFGATADDVRRARAIRFVVEAARGTTFREFEELLARLRESESTEELAVRVTLLARSPFHAGRVELADVLEELGRRSENGLAAGPRFLLARTYASIDRWDDAERVLRRLVLEDPRNALFLETLAEGLLRHDRVDEAEQFARRLDVVSPRGLPGTGLAARILDARGDEDAAVARLASYVAGLERTDDVGERFVELINGERGIRALGWLAPQFHAPDDRALATEIGEIRELVERGSHEAARARLGHFVRQPRFAALARRYLALSCARLLEDLGRPEAAEQVYRPVAESSGLAEDWLVVSRYLARQNRTSEALDVVQRVTGEATPERYVNHSLSVLRAVTDPADEQVERVEDWIRQARESAPREPRLLILEANLRDFQARYDEALALYEEALEIDATNVVAANNLAYLLALRGGDPRALPLVEGIIERIGPHPDAIDTRGMVYVAEGRTDEAIRDLERSVEAAPDAVKYLHLAIAYLGANDLDRARDALKQARERGLDAETIHPLERPLVDRLSTL